MDVDQAPTILAAAASIIAILGFLIKVLGLPAVRRVLRPMEGLVANERAQGIATGLTIGGVVIASVTTLIVLPRACLPDGPNVRVLSPSKGSVVPPQIPVEVQTRPLTTGEFVVVLVKPCPNDPRHPYQVQEAPEPMNGDRWYASSVEVSQPGDQWCRLFDVCAAIASEGVSPHTPVSKLPEGPSDCVRVTREDGGTLEPPPTGTETSTPSPTVPPPQEMTLREAIDQGIVDARVTGVGGPGGGTSSGDSIVLGLTERVSVEVRIHLPRGTVLSPSLPGPQNMVVRVVKGRTSSQQSTTYQPTATIVLTEGGEQWFLVEAYCLDSSLENPDYSTDFSVGGLATPQVLQVLEAADRLQPEPSLAAVQLAVWAANEDPTVADVTSRFSADQHDFDQARAILVEAGINPDSKRIFH